MSDEGFGPEDFDEDYINAEQHTPSEGEGVKAKRSEAQPEPEQDGDGE